jgi:hypothetical protein
MDIRAGEYAVGRKIGLERVKSRGYRITKTIFKAVCSLTPQASYETALRFLPRRYSI